MNPKNTMTENIGDESIKTERVGRTKLEHLLREVSDRDIEILKSVRSYRYLMTGQIRRLHFIDATSDTAGLRSTNRILVKLKELDLVRPLNRRIGGVRSGSGSLIFAISPTGARLLAMTECADDPIRKRFREPSPSFLEHTLAVAELSIRLLEMGFENRSEMLLKYELEPDCWRNYTNLGGVARTLKPDLYAATSSGDYEDHWFFEVDLETASPAQILKKCEQYLAYKRAGIEQRKDGVFPSVVYLVPTEKRKNSLKRHIGDIFREGTPEVFTVITMDELYPLIEVGAEDYRKIGVSKLKVQTNSNTTSEGGSCDV